MDLFAPRHLLLILLIVLLVFGTKKLKTIGADLGGAVRGFKHAMKDGAVAEPTAHEGQPAPQLGSSAGKRADS